MSRLNKREMVLEIYDREAMGEVTAEEISIINQGLIDEFGEGGAMAPAEIARILHDEELPVRFDQIFRMDSTADKYVDLFGPLNKFATLKEAETTLRKIEQQYKRFQAEGDRTGVRYARQAALRIKKQSAALSQSPELNDRLRAEMGEIAHWMTIWLQTPEIFDQWLELRKAAEEFKNKFGALGKKE